MRVAWDNHGKIIKKGDRVLVWCRVLEVEDDHFYNSNVLVEPITRAPQREGPGYTQQIYLNLRQVVKGVIKGGVTV